MVVVVVVIKQLYVTICDMRNSGGSISSSNCNRTISISTSSRTNDITMKAQYDDKRDGRVFIYI